MKKKRTLLHVWMLHFLENSRVHMFKPKHQKFSYVDWLDDGDVVAMLASQAKPVPARPTR